MLPKTRNKVTNSEAKTYDQADSTEMGSERNLTAESIVQGIHNGVLINPDAAAYESSSNKPVSH